ncbi:MAG: hypothetical protein ACP5P4_07855 [Steroidobacteraceae bacterium]
MPATAATEAFAGVASDWASAWEKFFPDGALLFACEPLRARGGAEALLVRPLRCGAPLSGAFGDCAPDGG